MILTTEITEFTEKNKKESLGSQCALPSRTGVPPVFAARTVW